MKFINFYCIVLYNKMENGEGETWRICCSNSSSHFIKFFVTFSICFSVMVFAMIQIINHPENDNSIYFSLISSILALYMDAPRLDQTKIIKPIEHKDNTDNV